MCATVYCHLLSHCLISTYLKIHVLYIVNLVSKIACHDIVTCKRKVHANFVQRNVCFIYFCMPIL